MASKNTRNARMLLCGTLGGTYVVVNKSHGLNIQTPVDWSEAQGHGARFKEYLAGLQDFQGALTAYYDTVYTTLNSMALNKISEFFQIYIDFSDTLNYIRGQCFVGLDGLNLDLGNTADESYSVRIANSDIDIIRAGVTILI